MKHVEPSNFRTLVVDDDSSVAEVLGEILTRDGYQVTVATDAEAGLKLLTGQDFKVLLVDIAMPKINGIELARRALKADPSLVVIFITGYCSLETARQAIALGAYDYILKPFTRTAVSEALHSALGRADQRHAGEPSGRLRQERNRAQEALARRLAVENALAQVSSIFATAESADVAQALGVLGRVVDADRAYIFQFRDDREKVDNTYEWCATGVEPQIDKLQGIEASTFPWWLERAQRNENIVISDVSQLPEAAAAERAILEAQDIKSIVVVPLFFAGQLLGLLGFDDVRGPRDWSEADVRLLHTASEIFMAYTQRIQAEEETKRRAARSEILAEISRLIAEAGLEYRAVLETVAERVSAVLGDACIVSLVSNDGQWLNPVALHHQDPDARALLRDLLMSVPQRADEGLGGKVVQTGQPVFLPGTTPEQLRPLLKPEHQPYLDRIGIYSVLIVPLRLQGRVIGVILVARDRPGRPYSEDDQVFLQETADRAALAVANARLFEETRRRLDQVQALRAIDEAIAASLDLHLSLGVFLDEAVSQLKVDAADVLVFDPQTNILKYAAGRGFRTTALQHTHLRLGEGYAGQAALDRRTVCTPSLVKQPNGLTRAPLLPHEEFVAYYAVPLMAKGQLKGVLELFHRVPLSPDREWLDFVEMLATQAAIAIDNVSLFNDLQRVNIDLALAYDATLEGWTRALDLRDSDTEGHSKRVADMTVRLAREMGIGEAELVHVRRGALLHDIGKMGIPDAILTKPQTLADQEWEVMRQHPVHAFQMLRHIAYLRPALDIPYCHHEKWDGSGYPRGLRGKKSRCRHASSPSWMSGMRCAPTARIALAGPRGARGSTSVPRPVPTSTQRL